MKKKKMKEAKEIDKMDDTAEAVEPVNAIGGGNLNREIDIQKLASELSRYDDINTEFTDENRWQLVIEFEGDGKILLYRTGSYIIRGGANLQALEETKNTWYELIKEEGIVDDTVSIDYSLQNIVFSGDLDQEVDLAVLGLQLGLSETEYEPEVFPGLIYRPDNHSVVLLIFASGKTIITGGTDRKQGWEGQRFVADVVH